MTKYHILKRMQFLLGQLAPYIKGTVMTEGELNKIVYELDELAVQLKHSEKQNCQNIATTNKTDLEPGKNHSFKGQKNEMPMLFI
jgi:hypothetical protein